MIYSKMKKIHEDGMTYIELMIVCLVIGILTTCATLLLRSNVRMMKINSTVGLIKNQIRSTRAEAIHKGTNQTLKFDQAGKKLIINGTTKIPIPDEVKFDNNHISGSTLTFTPRGNCVGNRLETIDIITDKEKGYRIRIIGATGTPDSFSLQ
jgi:Tfp pilus assembly protein FimT